LNITECLLTFRVSKNEILNLFPAALFALLMGYVDNFYDGIASVQLVQR